MEIKKMPKKQISKNNYNDPDNSSQLNIIHENNITRTNDNGINSAFLEINGNKKNAKYICKPCNFICNKNANYQSHLLTNKHYKNTNECCNVITNKCNNCDKEFSTLSGLWKHRKTCSIEVEVPQEAQSIIQGTKLTVGSSDIPIELILEVIKLKCLLVYVMRIIHHIIILMRHHQHLISVLSNVLNYLIFIIIILKLLQVIQFIWVIRFILIY